MVERRREIVTLSARMRSAVEVRSRARLRISPAAIPPPAAAFGSSDEETDQPEENGEDEDVPQDVSGESKAAEDREYQNERKQCDHLHTSMSFPENEGRDTSGPL
jgi:hypothetical protein